MGILQGIFDRLISVCLDSGTQLIKFGLWNIFVEELTVIKIRI
jgi:hypothetical protein